MTTQASANKLSFLLQALDLEPQRGGQSILVILARPSERQDRFIQVVENTCGTSVHTLQLWKRAGNFE